MLTFALFLLQAVPQISRPTPKGLDGDQIVVKGNSLVGAREALARCIATACTPDKEIHAALKYADQQFRAGDYMAARSTIADSRRRNGRFAKQYPVPVSDLARATTRLANLNGRRDEAMSGAIAAIGALKAGLVREDPLILMQRLELGDQMARLGRLDGASSIYRSVAAQARDIDNKIVEGHALFREAVLFSAVASVQSLYRSRALQAVNRVEARADPEFAPFRQGVALMKVRLAALEEKPLKRRVVLSDVPKLGVPDTVLIDEPFIDLSQPGLTGSQTSSVASEWADVAFRVLPDGSVADVEVRDTSNYRPGAWLPLKLQAVAGRRYAPYVASKDDPGLYRIERYSMIYDLVRPTGSLLAIRSSAGKLDTMNVSSTYRDPVVRVQ